MLYNLTSNQYYRGLNRRFDKRARRLRQLGFVCQASGLGFAVFAKLHRMEQWNKYIPASLLSSADNRHFWAAVRDALRYS